MTRSTSATARIHSTARYIPDHASPSTGVYDNIPGRIRYDAPPPPPPPPELPRRSGGGDSLPPQTKPDHASSSTATYDAQHSHHNSERKGQVRQHRSRHNGQSEPAATAVRPVVLPSQSGNLGIVHSGAPMSTVSICDVPSTNSISAAVHDSANTSPIWKRLDEHTDQVM